MSDAPLVGRVLPGPDAFAFAVAVVEGMTPADWRDLPPDLADATVAWAEALCRWVDLQSVPPEFDTEGEFIPGWVYDVKRQSWARGR